MKLTTLLSLVLSLILLPTAILAEETSTYEVKVPDMTCMGCAYSVTEELQKLDHITDVFVDPKTKIAIFATNTAEGPGKKAVFEAVKAAGYEGKTYKKLSKPFAEAKAALKGDKG